MDDRPVAVDDRFMRRKYAKPAQTEEETAGLHALFEARAAQQPDAIALVQGIRTQTYRQLDQEANRWARWLLAQGAVAEEPVALLFQPSIEMIVAMLAVLKAGLSYVPTHPEVTALRRQRILETTGARWLLTHGAVPVDGPLGGCVIVRMDDPVHAYPVAAQRPVRPPSHWTDGQLAYTMFTSGTTGAPKGIAIAHGGVKNLLSSTQSTYGLSERDAVLFLTPFHFDASVLDVFWPLSVGASVVIASNDEAKNPDAIGKLLHRHQITLFQCVPMMLSALVDARLAGRIPDPPALRQVICGGSVLSKRLFAGFRSAFRCSLANHYGPTEVTVDAASFACDGPPSGDTVPIGRPLHDTRVYVLDAHLRPSTAGVAGEIFVASPGLARGYAGDVVLTAERFLPDPFSREPGARMYRTGDRGRFDDGGDLEFVGRVDKQVKIRGNRVELEEVESHLAAHHAVRRASVCLCKGHDGEAALAAYVELTPRSVSLEPRAGLDPIRLFTLAQRPDLRPAMEMVHLGAWPDYFAGDDTLRQYWPRLWSEFPQYQFALAGVDDAVLAVGNAIPIFWDGTVEGLPRGWDGGLELGFRQTEEGVAPNTLLILTGVVDGSAKGRGLSMPTLRGFQTLARGLGLAHAIVPARPTGKTNAKDIGFVDWCERRRADGQLEDDWLRAHERIGGRLLRYDLESQSITGTLQDWERWTGRTFEASGAYALPGTLAEVIIDVEKGQGRYSDPSVWYEHRLAEPGWEHVDAGALRQHLRARVPEYMIPSHIGILPALPLLPSGKVDERALAELPHASEHAFVAPQGPVQTKLADIWCSVLQLDQVGATDDFFDLGGHSLRALQLLGRIEQEFRVKLSLRDVFLDRTLLGLERLIRAASQERSSHVHS